MSVFNDIVISTARITGSQKCLNDIYDCLIDYKKDCPVINYNNELFLMGYQCQNIIKKCQTKKSPFPNVIFGILLGLIIISMCMYFKSTIINFVKKITVISKIKSIISKIKPNVINCIIKSR